MKKYVVVLINSLNIGEGAVHVGIIVYSDKIGDEVSLSLPFKPKALLIKHVNNLRQLKGMTITDFGIQRMREMLKTQGRPNVPNVMIIYTDGFSFSTNQTIKAANFAKGDGITIISVAMGSRINL